MRRDGDLPLSDYALVGDMRTAALVARDGSVDWLCLPRFDGPAVLCRLLDARQGGWFRVGPVDAFEASRHYQGNTNVLVTEFVTARGRVRLTDFMPLDEDGTGRGPMLLRCVEGLAGEVDLAVALHATFDFVRAPARVEPREAYAVVRGGGQSLALRAPVRLEEVPGEGLAAHWRVRAGERRWVVLTSGAEEPAVPPTDAEAEALLAQTVDAWERWVARGEYPRPHAPMLRRSALTLKLLTYAPSGAHVAAPTTSLPEVLGGERNWDYRYTWLRDSAWLVESFVGLGYRDEAEAFLAWLQSLGFKRCSISVLYGVTGEDADEEQRLDHLAGYAGSRPVYVGNGARNQVQLDVYGEIIDAAWLFLESNGPTAMNPELWHMVRLLADEAARRSNEQDRGIWETRCRPLHHLSSKLWCWVAVDRALRLAVRHQLDGPLESWARARDALRELIETRGFDARRGAFTRAPGEPELDASLLLMPLVGFLPATDPRMRSTVARIREELGDGPHLYRYRHADGLKGREGTFAACGFWLVQVLALESRLDEAHALFEELMGYANDVGLLSEEIDAGTGRLLGNYPQGLTHLSLVRAGRVLDQVERQLHRDQEPTPHPGF